MTGELGGLGGVLGGIGAAPTTDGVNLAEDAAVQEAATVLAGAPMPREAELLAMVEGLKPSEVVRSVDLAGDAFTTLATTYDQAEAAILTHFDAAPVSRDSTMRDALLALVGANRALLALVKDLHLRAVVR